MERRALIDHWMVEKQLGRPPRGSFSVSTRCTYGNPQVICVHPIVDRQPFPTLYWLSCPFLGAKISVLEAAGEVGALEARMQKEGHLRDAVRRAHERYILQRRALLSEHDVAWLAAEGLLDGLMQRGIGGIRDFSYVKCLHLHVAHALADHNPLGAIVLESLPKHACSDQERICSA